MSITPIKDKSGFVTNFVAVLQDVTERKASEAAFKLRDHALSNLSEGITIADPNLPDCPLMYVNEAFCRMTGYEREEIIGRNCRFLQGPETDKASVARIRAAMEQVGYLFPRPHPLQITPFMSLHVVDGDSEGSAVCDILLKGSKRALEKYEKGLQCRLCMPYFRSLHERQGAMLNQQQSLHACDHDCFGELTGAVFVCGTEAGGVA